jgi:hypothetical protein
MIDTLGHDSIVGVGLMGATNNHYRAADNHRESV